MIPAELATIIIAASPIVELRGAIPVALGVYKLSVPSAYFFAILGNLLPIFSILAMGWTSSFLSRRFRWCERFFAWLFARTRDHHEKKFEKYRDLALVILVAIPLPFTGAWTGSLAAFVFGIPFKRAFPLIAIGVIIAGIIVTFFSIGVLRIST